MRVRAPFKTGETVGVLKGIFKGKVGRIVKLGTVYVSVQFIGKEDFPTISKTALMRLLRKEE